MKNLIKLAGVAAVVLASSQAYAQTATGDVIFSGSIDNVCTITVGRAGTLVGAAGNTQLSSRAVDGGQSGQATVDANAAIFNLSAADPINFTGTPTDPADTVPSTSHNTNFSSTDIGVTDVTTAGVPVGSSLVDVNLVTTADTGVFPSGTYSATVVLTCE